MAAPAAILVAGLDRPESVAWDPATRTLVTGGAGGQVYRVDPMSRSFTEIAQTGGSVLGVALDLEGRIYLCDKSRAAVLRLSPDGGSMEDLTTAADGTPAFTLPNGLAFGPLGELYVSDSGRLGAADGRILVRHPDGRLGRASPLPFRYPNGLAVAADGGTLFAVQTELPGYAAIPIDAPGVLGTLATTTMPGTVPDGILLADGDRPLVTLWRPDAIVMPEDPEASPVAEDWRGLTLSAPTGACFFGDSMRSLAVANRGAGHLSVVDTELTGPLPHRPAVRGDSR